MKTLHTVDVDDFDTTSTSDTKSSRKSNQNDKKSFSCDHPGCGKIFKFKSELTRHCVIHEENRPYPCPHEGCGKSFKRADALEAHTRLHTKDMPFACDFDGCDKKFLTKAALKYHKLRHSEERSFQCSFPGCGKSFYTKGQLKQHENALNYHMNLSAVNGEGQTPQVIMSGMKDSEGYSKEFYPPSPKVMQEIEWEIKNQPMEEFDTAILEGNGENLIKNLLENEEKIELATEIVDNFKEGDEFNFQISNNEEWSELIKEPSVFFDESDFKILDFLREQAHTNYY